MSRDGATGAGGTGARPDRERDAAIAFLGFEDESAHAAGAAAPAPETGERFGDFVIEAEIARGGMGTVYLARQLPMGRRVALKLVPDPPDATPARAQRLEREARILGTLRHEGIVTVHAAGAARGFRFVAMDFVEGATLRDVIAGRSPSPAAPRPGDPAWIRFAIEVGERVARALGAAHAHGVVHRDVKPENVILDAELRPVLVDFGLARDGAPDSATRTLGFVGTPRYSSPEQARGEPLGPPTDVFSLGVVLFEALAGEPAFRGTTSARLLEAIQFDDVSWPSSRRVPRDVRAVVEKCLEKRTRDRYADGSEAAADLARLLRYEPIEAAHRGPIARRARRARLRPARAAAAIAFVGLAATAAGSTFLLGRESAAVRRAAEDSRRLEEARRLFLLGDLAREEAILADVSAGSDAPAGAVGLLADRRLRRGDARGAIEAYGREIGSGGTYADFAGRAIAEALVRGDGASPEPPGEGVPEPATARDHAARAALLDRRGEHDAALEAYSRAIALEPAAFLWHFDRGRLELRMRLRTKAVADLWPLRDRPTFDRKTVRDLGWALYNLARYDEQEAALRGALATWPDDPVLLVDLSVATRLQGRPEESDVLWRRARELAPDEPYVLAICGAQLVNDQRFDEARRVLEDALERFPDDASVRFHLAYLEQQLGRHAEVEAVARPLLTQVDRRYGVEGLALVAKAEEARGRVAEAEASYARLRRADPENAKWPTQHGHMLLRLERFGEAEKAFEEAVALDPRRPDSLYGLGQVLRRTGRTWDAILVYDRALALEPKRGETHYWLAHLWYELDVPEAAVRYVALAVEQFPTWFDAWAVKGAVEAASGALDAADASYRRALELRPGHPHVSADYAEVLDRLGRDREALALYGAARAAEPGLAVAWCGEGLLRLDSDDAEVNDPDEAVLLLERACELEPDDAEYRAYLERARKR